MVFGCFGDSSSSSLDGYDKALRKFMESSKADSKNIEGSGNRVYTKQLTSRQLPKFVPSFGNSNINDRIYQLAKELKDQSTTNLSSSSQRRSVIDIKKEVIEEMAKRFDEEIDSPFSYSRLREPNELGAFLQLDMLDKSRPYEPTRQDLYSVLVDAKKFCNDVNEYINLSKDQNSQNALPAPEADRYLLIRAKTLRKASIEDLCKGISDHYKNYSNLRSSARDTYKFDREPMRWIENALRALEESQKSLAAVSEEKCSQEDNSSSNRQDNMPLVSSKPDQSEKSPGKSDNNSSVENESPSVLSVNIPPASKEAIQQGSSSELRRRCGKGFSYARGALQTAREYTSKAFHTLRSKAPEKPIEIDGDIRTFLIGTPGAIGGIFAAGVVGGTASPILGIPLAIGGLGTAGIVYNYTKPKEKRD